MSEITGMISQSMVAGYQPRISTLIELDRLPWKNIFYKPSSRELLFKEKPHQSPSSNTELDCVSAFLKVSSSSYRNSTSAILAWKALPPFSISDASLLHRDILFLSSALPFCFPYVSGAEGCQYISFTVLF